MTRRQFEAGMGDPLFDEDWWSADQRLFEDSLTRRASRRPAPRRARRPATLRKQDAAANAASAQAMLPLFEDPPGNADEQLRGDGPGALGAVAAQPVRPDRGSGQLLLGFGDEDRGEDRRAGVRDGGRRPARGGVPGEGRPSRGGPAPGGADRVDRGHRAGSGAGSGRGRGGQAGARSAAGIGGAVRGRHQGPVASGFRPSGQDDLAPSGAVARVRANLAALSVLRTLRREQRPATADEQAVLARWSGWGAVPEVFDTGREEFAWAREQLADLLTPGELAAASRNTLNAHYTDAAIVQAVWSAVQALGFEGGQVLEPGCGSGNFIGFARPSAHVTGVELEPLTAAIAAALYPRAQVLAESFADTRAPDGSFDLAIGNVPFSQAVLHDRRYNLGGHSIHNHFIIKSLRLVKPGGLAAVLTSRYTMDARNPAARREIAALADLVGAVRLPTGAHRRAAGTSVVTDLLILRRREPGRHPQATDWELTRTVVLDGHQVAVNEYFLDHRHLVLGELGAVNGAYRADDLAVTASASVPLAEALTGALDMIAADGCAQGLTWSPAPAGGHMAVTPARQSSNMEGHLDAGEDGSFTKVTNGRARPVAVPRSQAAELRALLGLRDTARALLDAEASSLEGQIDGLRAELGRRYDDYVRAHGPLNRFSLRRTGRTDPQTGEQKMARIRPPQGGFRSDPLAPLVLGLEEFDPVGQRAAKAAIFHQRVVAPRTPRLGADTPADALAICLDTYGEVRLPDIARLLGTSEDQARADLGTLVFNDPAHPGRLVPAAEYLSGNVRGKLREAERAAQDDPRFTVNTAELRKVLPADLTPGEIDARLGAAWIDASHVQQFLREILDDDRIQVEHPGGQIWTVRGNRYTVLATSTWGTGWYPAAQLAQAILEQRKIEVRDTVQTPDGERTVVNVDATLAAQEKAAELGERFCEWAWEDPRRAETLARAYNEKFNNLVLRSYDDAELSLPGLTLAFQPRRHQVAAVARMIHEPSVLLAHEVGAGKTAEMIIGVAELRRLGMVRKPVVVVPNHMLDQFAREWLQLYPQANVLVAHREDLQRDRRRHFVARCATGDWDGVVMSTVGVRAHSAQRRRAACLPGSRTIPDAPVARNRQEGRRAVGQAAGGRAAAGRGTPQGQAGFSQRPGHHL